MIDSKRTSKSLAKNIKNPIAKSDAIANPTFEQLASGNHANANFAAIHPTVISNMTIINPDKLDKSNSYLNTELNTDKRWYKKLLALPAYYWVLITQVVVILPHAAHLPAWLIGFALISIIAQLPVIKAKFKRSVQRKRFYQGMQMLGFLLGLLGLWLTYNTAFGLDMGVAFLVLCLVSKLWELYKRRDAYVVLNLSLFVLAALFLMDQGLLTTLEVIVGVLAILLAFIALNDDSNRVGDGRMRTLGVLAISALPLLIVLFLFFPRLPPLWSVKLSGQSAMTGVSDSMSPGDFANLGQSTELAFRVEFDNVRPAQSDLYWRGLVFSDFDGITWRRNPLKQQQQWQWETNRQSPQWLIDALATAEDKDKLAPMTYQVILEPTQQRWLFGLDYPFAQQQKISMTPDFTLLKDQPVTQQLRYNVLRYAPMRIDPVLSTTDQAINLALPAQGNPKSRALARQLFRESGSDPQRYMSAIQRWINQGEFRYTLAPPKLNQNRIDGFLFDTKAGFCEHYSSSFTFMLRAAGIPARVITGYQGGELSNSGNVWEVRQMDAHAWTEVWLEGQGWVRVDPTAFVAPERIEQGMDAMTQTQGAAMFGNGTRAQISYQQYQMLQTLRRLSDQASYYWQKDIVGYDQDKQAGSLLKWFNIGSIKQQLLWLTGAALLVMSLLVLIIWQRRRQRWHPVDLILIKLSKRIGRQDQALTRQDSEGQLAWLERLASVSRISDNSFERQQEVQQSIDSIKQTYRQLRYGRLSAVDERDVEYKQVFKQFKQQVRALF